MSSEIHTFGYKMAWLAIKNTNAEEVGIKLNLRKFNKIGWKEGIEKIYEDDNVILITPTVNKWTFIVGKFLYDFGSHKEDLSLLKERLEGLSLDFEEVQAFATHRVSEYHHWICAKNGMIERCFAYVGESGKVLLNQGELTEIEKTIPWSRLKSFQWFPNEKTVLSIADSWSINPVTIQRSDLKGDCLLGPVDSFSRLLN